MKQQLFALFITSILFSLSVGSVNAASNKDSNCQPIYGGGETCENGVMISIDKKILRPITGQEVDNLGVNDPKFKPGSTVLFNIYVTNTGATVLKNIELTDTMPKYTTFTSGSTTYDVKNNIVKFVIPQLKPGQMERFQIKGTIAVSDKLPENQGIVCTLNTVAVGVGNAFDEDTAGFCIQKDVLQVVVTPTTMPSVPSVPSTPSIPSNLPQKNIPPTSKGGQPIYQAPKPEKSPETGPELFGLIGLLSAGFGGHLLRKKSK